MRSPSGLMDSRALMMAMPEAVKLDCLFLIFSPGGFCMASAGATVNPKCIFALFLEKQILDFGLRP